MNLSAEYIEGLLADYRHDPSQVPEAWRPFFDAAETTNGSWRPAPSFQPRSIFRSRSARPVGDTATQPGLQARVANLVHAYRTSGHLAARLDPLGRNVQRARGAEADCLAPENHGLRESDFDRPVPAGTIAGWREAPLRELLERLQKCYCGSVGVELMHIDQPAVRQWVQDHVESLPDFTLDTDRQRHILRRLTTAAVFEEFARKKYMGSKTFSLEGAESLVPMLDAVIGQVAEQGVREIVLGMAHRGRLNVLANVIGKPARDIFRQFEDNASEENLGSGDVHYHLGHSGDWEADGRQVHLSLCFNPSHLEFVCPVALGRMRAKQDRLERADDSDSAGRGLVLLIHGDAGFAGEGIVQESLNLSRLDGYSTGGTLHIVIDNQLGFTTGPGEGRSTTYATGVARLLQIPIFHVNGEDLPAIMRVVRLALDFRREFHRDVVIDLYCYRRWGHNEGDEPSFTQPLLYQAIEDHTPLFEKYRQQLLKREIVSEEETSQWEQQSRDVLAEEYEAAQDDGGLPAPQSLGGVWQDFSGGPEPDDDAPDTGVARDRLTALLQKIAQVPDGFHRHRKLQRSVKHRRAMADGDRPLHWSAAEALALASLAVEGHAVRLAGQDTARGTFSQRHAVLFDTGTGQPYETFGRLDDGQAPVTILNSPLSEAGALGFEYGYSLDYPDALVAWEAQFGDFWNAGQVIVDQFLASAEDKWRRLSGLVLLLPHGFEGMGPEHSSARLERFLMLASEDNLQVAVPTTAAQYFHCLRRQVLRRWRKPLVVMTPKSLLRHPRVASSLDECAGGQFERVLPDAEAGESAERVLLCCGKVYYDLTDAREQRELEGVSVIRLEQLYPFPLEQLRAALEPFADDTPLCWVQEEPGNMGAWPYLRWRFGARLFDRFDLHCVAREESASPATGSHTAHKLEQEKLIDEALAP